MLNSKFYSKNSEILFIYDAKLCNPNGDPDDENKPRMDYETKRNLVSDVRLKRYIRDYLESIGKTIFVTKVDGKSVTANERLNDLIEKMNIKIDFKKMKKDDIDFLLDNLIDVRFFGATMPIQAGEEEKGAGANFIGPIQFNWGYSLNKVELVESSSITSTFAGKVKEYGTFGKDWRVYYSFIAFYGIISGYRAEFTKLSEDDVKFFDAAILNSVPKIATTRSKIGQSPRFYLRVEYKDKDSFIGDLRNLVKLSKIEGLRDISDFEVDIDDLINVLKDNKDRLSTIYIFEDKELNIKGGSLSNRLKDFCEVKTF